MAHIVTAPLVITKKEDGSDLYLYQGAALPSFAKTAEIKRLSDEGFIAKVAVDALATTVAPLAESN